MTDDVSAFVAMMIITLADEGVRARLILRR